MIHYSESNVSADLLDGPIVNFAHLTHSTLINEALSHLNSGSLLAESKHLDYKEEAARRDNTGRLKPGSPRHDKAVPPLAGEVACMANTPRGGVLMLGVSDDGSVPGTELDAEWLRRRLFEALDRQLTVTIEPVEVRGQRILVILCPEAVEPIKWKNKYTWRLDTSCVEMDQTSWHQRKYGGWHDWSCESSPYQVSSVTALAMECLTKLTNLERVTPPVAPVTEDTEDLLRRVGAVTAAPALTNGAALLLIGQNTANLEYIRRPFAGADRQERYTGNGQPLLQQLMDVLSLIRAYNPEQLVGDVVANYVRSLPESVVREVIVNAIAHRDWSAPGPIVIEHTADQLTVTSPGGFFGGVTPQNIINHPSVTRNVGIATMLHKMGIAEREAIGVDRMFSGMLALGHLPPDILEDQQREVQVVVCGGRPHRGWLEWLGSITPAVSAQDIRLLMLLYRLATTGWADAQRVAEWLQVRRNQVSHVLAQADGMRYQGEPLVARGPDVDTVGPLLCLSSKPLAQLQSGNAYPMSTTGVVSAEAKCIDVARSRGRINSAEAGLLTGNAPQNAVRVLKRLAESGALEPSRPSGRGPGLFYRPT